MARPKLPKKQHKVSKVIRIPDATYKKLRQMTRGRPLTEFFELILPYLELDVQYLVGGTLFTDIKEARGELIVRRAKQDYETKIKLIVIIGNDNEQI